MANLNKVMLIGRLTRDPEIKTFSNGGKVANIGFAVNNKRKNKDTDRWEDVPVWVDVKAFSNQTGRKLADMVEKYLRKGAQIYIEGHLTLEEWMGKDGQKRNKTVVVADAIEFLDKRGEGGGGSGAGAAKSAAPEGDDLEEVPF